MWGSPAILYSAQLGAFVVAIAGIKLELIKYMDVSKQFGLPLAVSVSALPLKTEQDEHHY